MPSSSGSPAAARVGDPVVHNEALTGLVEGALLGAALGGIVVMTGGAGALAIAGAMAGGASLGGTIGKLWGKHHTVTTGVIVTGSPNVTYNGRPAAFVGSLVRCDKHPGPQTIIQGAAWSRVNGRPAAREGSECSCGCVVGTGSPNVFIGGPSTAAPDLTDDVPWYADAALLVLGLAGGGVGLALKGFSAVQIVARLGAGVLGGTAGSVGTHAFAGRFFAEGSVALDVLTLAGGAAGGLAGGVAGGVAEEAVTLRVNPARYYLNKANTVDVSTPPNKAIFYSGTNPSGVKNGALAQAFSQNGQGFLRIEDTPGGRWMDAQQVYGKLTQQEADAVWTRMSERYAGGATGDVTTYVDGASPTRVYMTTELPILQARRIAGVVGQIKPGP